MRETVTDPRLVQSFEKEVDKVEVQELRDFLLKAKSSEIPIDDYAFGDEMIANQENREAVLVDKNHEQHDEKMIALSSIGLEYNKKRGIDGEAFLRESVAERLKNVDEKLREEGLYIFVDDGWRSLEIQKRNKVNWIQNKIEKEGFSEEQARKAADSHFSNSEPTAPHLSGGAFDLILKYVEDDRPVPMKPWDRDVEGNKMIEDPGWQIINGNDGDLVRSLVARCFDFKSMEDFYQNPKKHLLNEKNKKKYINGFIAGEMKKLEKNDPESFLSICQNYSVDPPNLENLQEKVIQDYAKRWSEIVKKMEQEGFVDEKVMTLLENRRMQYHLVADIVGATPHPHEFWHAGIGDRTSAFFQGPDAQAYYEMIEI